MPHIIIMSEKTTISGNSITIEKQTKIINNGDDTKPKSFKRRRTEFTCYGCGEDLPTDTLHLDLKCQNCSKFWCGDKCAPMRERCGFCGAKIPPQ